MPAPFNLSFREFLLEREELKNHPKGTYVSVKPNKETQNKLDDFFSSIDIPNIIDKDDYHATVLFSKKGIPKAKGYEIPMPIVAKATSWELFDTQMPGSGKCLVLKIESDDLTKHHNHYIKAFGGTHDYDSYKPHLTASYSFTGKKPGKLPDFDIIFDSYKFEPIKGDWTTKVKKK